jgi:hypothetical protein
LIKKNKENIDKKIGNRWRVLKQQMAGVFCAALSTDSVKSMPFVEPSINSNFSKISQYYPSESVCSENIDAWVKLMPHSTRLHGKTVDIEIGDGNYRDRNKIDNSKNNSNSQNEANSSSICNKNHLQGLSSLVRSDWLLHSPYYSLNLRAKSQKMIPNNKINSDNRSNKIDDRDTPQQTQKRRLKLTLTVSITAVLLPNLLSLHTILVNKLKENTCTHIIDNTLIQKTEDLPLNKHNLNKNHRASSQSGEMYNSNIDDQSDKDDINVSGNTTDTVDYNVVTTSDINDTNHISQISTDSNLAFDRIQLDRGVRDSRLQHFAVHMTVTYEYTNSSIHELGSIRVQVLELMPPFYRILLHTYKYSIYDDNGTSAFLYVADVPSFVLIQHGLSDERCFEHSSDVRVETGITVMVIIIPITS